MSQSLQEVHCRLAESGLGKRSTSTHTCCELPPLRAILNLCSGVAVAAAAAMNLPPACPAAGAASMTSALAERQAITSNASWMVMQRVGVKRGGGINLRASTQRTGELRTEQSEGGLTFNDALRSLAFPRYS